MRISEEIDALEVMSIPSLTYLVCTRLVAMVMALIPLYLVALFTSFFGTRVVTTGVSTACRRACTTTTSTSTCRPIDILYSLIKVIVFAIEVSLIHSYFGYYATGGPAGVGPGRRHGHPHHDHRGRPHQPAPVVPVLGRRTAP